MLQKWRQSINKKSLDSKWDKDHRDGELFFFAVCIRQRKEAWREGSQLGKKKWWHKILKWFEGHRRRFFGIQPDFKKYIRARIRIVWDPWHPLLFLKKSLTWICRCFLCAALSSILLLLLSRSKKVSCHCRRCSHCAGNRLDTRTGDGTARPKKAPSVSDCRLKGAEIHSKPVPWEKKSCVRFSLKITS